MIFCILAGNKLHLSEIARSLKEDITLKKTIERLSRNLNAFKEKQSLMQNYLTLVKRHIKDDYAVIVIDNSEIAKPASRKLEALFEIRDGSTGEITQGYLTIEAAVLSESGKMPLPVYEKVFSAAEKGFVSETYENLCCLESLSENFSKKCVRTLDRGFDANDYYRYFLKHNERFVIRAKKNRNVIYNGKTCNIMEAADRYKGNYCIHYKGKNGKTVSCKMSCIPVKLCEFPARELTLVAVYGFGYMKARIDYEGVQRIEQFMFHKDAFREILLNAIVHKDYSSCNPIQISVYEDKIYIWNDGEMPPNLNSTEKLFMKHSSKPFNPKLAEVFFKSGMIEAWGRSFEKIREACALYDGPLPEYENNEAGIMVLCKACDKYLELLSAKEKVDSIISDERIMIGFIMCLILNM